MQMPPEAGASVYEQLQRRQRTLWAGTPLTVCFDYQPYLKEPVRCRVNVRMLNVNEFGEVSLLGYCHDHGSERTFRLGSIQGEVLIERTGASFSLQAFRESLEAGELEEASPLAGD